MNAGGKMKKRLSITLRTALLSWLVTIVTLLTFVMVIIPEQKRAFLENLNSKAHGVAVSLRDVAAGSVVSADFSSVVDHCIQMLEGDSSLDYLVITRNDGFSLIHERAGWRQEDTSPDSWHPVERVPSSGIGIDPFFHRRVFHYSQPFDYSGIEWGWIHVGLSLESYDRSVAAVYWRTGLLAVVFVVLSLLASVGYARRLVRPILNLQEVVRTIAGGNLSARASIEGGDELANLAFSVNTMTESLLRRDKSLQSVRFAAQRFLSTTDWKEVIEEILETIGEAARGDRAYVFENRSDEKGRLRSALRHEWVSASTDPQIDTPNLLEFPWSGAGYDRWADLLQRGETLSGCARELGEAEQELLRQRGVKSLILSPIRVEDFWWGFLGLDACTEERKWTEAEQDSLRAIADMLGAAIVKQQTQDALLRAKEAAEAASRAKSQFLANMSHEIRTPMNGVLGMIDLLVHTPLNDKQLHYARTARSSGEALLAIIDDVLDLSKIEAGKLQIEEIVFDVPQIVEEVVDLLAGRTEQKVKLTASVAPDVPRLIVGDPGRLRQVLLNMVSNAIKFTERGEVSVRVSLASGGKESVRLRFEVQDSGMGIPWDAQAAIFDPFIQADGSTTRKFGGTGLGLAIAKQIVQMMGGEIGVISAINQGSTFWFTIMAPRAAQTAAAAVSSRGGLESRKILVIGSSPTRLRLQQMLSLAGMIPDTAENGWQAMTLLRGAASLGTPYEAVLLDSVATDEEGGELVRTLKTEATGPKIVLVAAPESAAVETRMRSLGIDAVLNGPVRTRQLMDCLDGLLGTGRPDTGAQPYGPRAGKAEFSARVLVAEDNLVNQQVVANMLEIFGCEVEVVANGAEALRAWSQRPYELVLMDCQMPAMDGYEATRAMRREEAASAAGVRIPVVALTAHAMAGDRERCLAAGMDDYLPKPFTVEELRAVLERWLPRGAGTASGPLLPAPIGGKPADREETDETGVLQPNLRASAKTAVFQGVVLVAEDEPVIQEVISTMLKRLGCQVDMVTNGREALASLAQRRYDLIFMDLHMPEMGGCEAARAIRSGKASLGSRVPIIAMTGGDAKNSREECFRAGMNDYLGKPFSLKTLQDILEHWLYKAPPSERSIPAPGALPALKALDLPPSPPRSTPGTDPCLDREALNRLCLPELSDAGELLERLVGIYLKESPRLLEGLRTAVESHDPTSARRAAHSLKSSSATLGATRLAALCIQIEALAEPDSFDRVRELLPDLLGEFDRVRKALQAELA